MAKPTDYVKVAYQSDPNQPELADTKGNAKAYW